MLSFLFNFVFYIKQAFSFVLLCSVFNFFFYCSFAFAKINDASNSKLNSSDYKTQSRFAYTLSKLGFDDLRLNDFDSSGNFKGFKIIPHRVRQIALVENLYLSHAFNRNNLKIGLFGLMKIKIQDIESLMRYFNSVLTKAGAYKKKRSFDAAYVLDNFFQTKLFSLEDIENFIVYLSQSVLNRGHFQEVGEMNSENGIVDSQKYFENAKKMGFVDEVVDFNRMDYLWILGASRPSMMSRIEFVKHNYCSDNNCLALHNTFKNIFLVTGWRRLWAEIDGIGDSSEEKSREGLHYMAGLARKYRISCVGNFFIEDKSVGSVRTYFNDKQGELRETIMVKDLYKEIIGEENYVLIDTLAPNHKLRPDTKDCTKDAISLILDKHTTGEIKIAIVSNQPHLLRQSVGMENIVDQILKEKNIKDLKVVFVPVGSGLPSSKALSEKTINVIKFETAAYIMESYIKLRKDSVSNKLSVDAILKISKSKAAV